jgi:CRP-like cAMP-binding protein
MEESEDMSGIRAKGEEAVGELAQALLENPVFNSALARALGAGERAMAAQRSALGALNVASGSDVERLEQRLRSLSARLEAIEDRVDEIAGEVFALARGAGPGSGPEPPDRTALADSEAEA